jgi:hypothetical protein
MSYPLKTLRVFGDVEDSDQNYYYQYIEPSRIFHVYLRDKESDNVKKHTISYVSKLFDLGDGKFLFVIKNTIILTCIHLNIIDEKEYWAFYASYNDPAFGRVTENAPQLEIPEMVNIEECESIIKKRLRCFNVTLKNGKKVHITAVAFGSNFFIDS